MAVTTDVLVLDTADLPAASSPELVVVPATAQEYEQTWLLNANEWKGPLDLAQYLDRERFLIERDLTKNDGITAWILTSPKLSPNPDGTRPILSSCETVLKWAYIAREGNLKKIRAHGVASVYTRPVYRGRGYAGRMMQEVGKQLETFQQANGDQGVFSVLFSDIGQTFYARYGWTTFASTHIQLDPLDQPQYLAQKTVFEPVLDLDREQIAALPTAAYLEETLKAISIQDPHVSCVAIRPDVEHFDWHQAREEIQAKLLNLPPPDIKGAIHEPTGIAIIWNRVFATKPQEWALHVLHIAIPPALKAEPTVETKKALSALLMRAQHEAYIWAMAAGVEVWDPSELVISAAQALRTEEQGKVEVIRRDKEHLCSLRLVGQADTDATKNVVWVNMEKYTWC